MLNTIFLEHNPEKLKEPNFVKDTLLKYKGKEDQLIAALEKKYAVTPTLPKTDEEYESLLNTIFLEHNPEKLKEPNFVKDTLLTYKGKEDQLIAALEKKYAVTVEPLKKREMPPGSTGPLSESEYAKKKRLKKEQKASHASRQYLREFNIQLSEYETIRRSEWDKEVAQAITNPVLKEYKKDLVFPGDKFKFISFIEDYATPKEVSIFMAIESLVKLIKEKDIDRINELANSPKEAKDKWLLQNGVSDDVIEDERIWVYVPRKRLERSSTTVTDIDGREITYNVPVGTQGQMLKIPTKNESKAAKKKKKEAEEKAAKIDAAKKEKKEQRQFDVAIRSMSDKKKQPKDLSTWFGFGQKPLKDKELKSYEEFDAAKKEKKPLKDKELKSYKELGRGKSGKEEERA